MSVFVSGAAGGVGRALVSALASRGEALMATDLDEAALSRAAREAGWPDGRVLLRGLDVRDAAAWPERIAEAEERLGPVSLGLNAAGCLLGGPALDCAAQDVARVLDVNARGTLLGSLALARAMRAHGRGHVINFGSMTALVPSPGYAIYGASKYAVRGFSLALAEELRGSGVAVTLVCTGSVDTPMLAPEREAGRIARGARLLAPDDVAQAVLAPRVLARRPRELYLPAGKGWLARAIDLWPAALLRFLPRRS